jgi:hypothetical protein
MGTDAEILVFDYDVYTSEVVPAFREALLTGAFPEWLDRALKKREIKLQHKHTTDILRHCTYFDRDFSWIGPYDEKDIYESDWPQRACKSDACPERDHCPFHLNQPQESAEELLWLFEYAVSMKCLSLGQFVGRSMVVTNYWTALFQLGVTQQDPILNLLAFLGKRGFVIGYQWGFGYEGINGWLNPAETLELAIGLDELPLPRYELSFEAMRSFNRPNPNEELYEKFGLTQYIFPGTSFEALSLSFVRTVATIAANENKGVLWGNGVMSADFYLNSPEWQFAAEDSQRP